MTIILSSSIWNVTELIVKNSAADVILSVLTCLLCLITKYTVIEFSLNCLLINFEKKFSNFLITFLKINLSVTYFKNQIRKKIVSEAFDVTRIRSIFFEIEDLDWFKIISINFSSVVNLINEAFWWSLSIKLTS